MSDIQTAQKIAVVPVDKALDFIMGGNATFTVANILKEERFTFKILHCEPDGKPEYYRVSVLVGPDNVNNYKVIAEIKEVDGMPEIKSRSVHEAGAFKLIQNIYFNLLFTQYHQIDMYEIWHTGRCSRCGRLLTVPESISKGIGPECETKLNSFMEQYYSTDGI